VFLASYLRDTRQVMVIAGRRFLGLTIRHQALRTAAGGGGDAKVLLFYIRDIGSS